MSKGILLSRLAVLGSGCLAMIAGGCAVHVHDHGPEYRERVVYREPEPPPAVVTTVYEPVPAEVVTVYEPQLNPHGHWVMVRDYGRCWIPNERAGGWRPYTVGHWVDTPDGWCWVSEDREAEWGQITYHYGRWYEDREYGWVWVPGSTWGPAWVAWRGGDQYSGWAPLPPQCGYGADLSVTVIDRYVPADRYYFVETRYIDQPRVRERFVQNNVTIINQTTNITNITIVNNRVVNRGVAVAAVERSSGHQVQLQEVAHARTEAEAAALRNSGRPVAYIPPAVAAVDTQYRARVERRVAEAHAAEKSRVTRRVSDEEAAKQAEHDRAVRRAQDANTAEKQRVDRRITDAEASKEAEKNRVDRRMTDEEAAKQAEHDRAVRRAQDAKNTAPVTPLKSSTGAPMTDEERAAAHERAVRRAQDAAKANDPKATPNTSSKTNKPPLTPEEEKAAAHERAVRRAQDAKAAEDKANSGK